MEDPDYFLPAAAALRAGMSEVDIHTAINRGELRAVVYRGDVRIPREAFQEFLERSRATDGAEVDDRPLCS